MQQINYNLFFKKLILEFPEIKEKILDEDWIDLPHLQMSELAIYAIKNYEKKDFNKLNAIFFFVEESSLMADSELYNMIGVSFIENIALKYDKKTRTWLSRWSW